jgi:hypothetical protein
MIKRRREKVTMKQNLETRYMPSNLPSIARYRAGLARRALGAALLLFVPPLVAGSCGGLTPDTVTVSGESHFLRSCTSTCGGGLDCINGLCSRGCLVGEAGNGSCRELATAASCTAESVEPGAVAVCDVSCTTSAECTALGEHACVDGYCRSDLASTLVCSDYRNRPGDDSVKVMIRNDRSTAIFLAPYVKDCNDAPHLVRGSRRGREVGLHYPRFCGGDYCQQIQDGARNEQICPDACISPTLIRLEPGSELEAGSFASEFVSHGRFPDTALMPIECAPSQNGPAPCVSEVGLMPGPYEFTAQAFLDCTAAGVGGSCDCQTPLERGSCTTGASVVVGEYEPIRGGITVTTNVDLPAATATLSF